MLSDKELFVQIIERDVLNLYQSFASKQALLGLPIVQNAVFSYADRLIEYFTSLVFGANGAADVEEAAKVAKYIANDKIEEYKNKIEEYRKQIKEQNIS